MPVMPDDYYNRHNPEKRYSRHLFRASKALQGSELNELQDQNAQHIQGVADAILSDGDILKGCVCSIDSEAGTATIDSGTVYLRGRAHDVDGALLNPAMIGTVLVGVYYQEVVITELEDSNLRDPAVGTRNYQEPGAARLQIRLVWGVEGDGGEGYFYPIHTLIDGTLLVKAPPPQLDSVTTALARYDRESNGSYVVEGLRVRVISGDGGRQVVSVGEGKAHIDGYELELPRALRLITDDNPTLATILSEPHHFAPDGNGDMRIDLNHAPVESISVVDITAEKSVTLTHGGYSGASDQLPDAAVLEIVSITQGATVFVQGTNYIRSGDHVDWSLGGDEPAPGSSYDVVYHYRTQIPPTLVDEDGLTVSGAVDGTLVMIDYQWRLPRVDLITLDRDGQVRRVEGLSHAYTPPKPTVPRGQTALASLDQNWRGAPSVSDVTVRVIPMADIESMRDAIGTLYDLIAIERLRNDANAADPAAKYGVFVDPLLDDDMRDQGLAQTAAIVDGELMLPISASVAEAGMAVSPWILDFDLEPVLTQPAKTGSMKINPYQVFDPLPARVSLRLATDRWTQTVTNWASDVTRAMTRGSGSRSSTSTQISTELLASRTTQAAELRQQPVNFELSGFGSEEALDTLRFDGVDVVPDSIVPTDTDGKLSGQFTVPAGIPAGSKSVEFIGAGGGFGDATYTGRGEITTQEMRRVVTQVTQRWNAVDPLAQTFVLNEGRHIGGVDVQFETIGTTPVRAQIRETTVGMPNQEILAAGEILATDITLVGTTRITWEPVWLEGGREYALVLLTDDGDHAVAIAQLGKYDAARATWITSQPYQVGVLLSSSNASTWTPHQDMDLFFTLLGAKFSQASRTIDLGEIDADQVSDLLTLAGVELTGPDTEITLTLNNADGEAVRAQAGEPINLSQRLAGSYALKAELSGSDWRSPVLYPGVQAVLGNLSESADYISRAIPCGADRTISFTCEAWLPGQSGLAVSIQAADSSWVPVLLDSSMPVGENWEERRFILTGHTATETRAKVVLSGTALDRPRARNFRLVVT
ncbi:MAG: DUF4815 domain-containing protein [Magnetococcales bacterium]|nr:DUF4815 domain-containing protein [Magnetococcales bacterium]